MKNKEIKKKIATGILIGTSITGIASSTALSANTKNLVDNEVTNNVMDAVSTRSNSSSRTKNNEKEIDVENDVPAKSSERIVNTNQRFSSHLYKHGPNTKAEYQKFENKGFQRFYNKSMSRQLYGYITGFTNNTFDVFTGLFKPNENDSKFYYSDESNGNIQTGLKKVNGNYYYFGDKQEEAYARHGWKRISGKLYYFDEDGKAVSGFKKIDGINYLFDKNCQLVEGLKSDKDGNMIYINKGTKQYGWRSIDGKMFFFDRNNKGYAIKSDFYHDGTGYTYLDKDGVMVKGVQKIGKDIYVFTPYKNGRYYMNYEFYTNKENGKNDRYYFKRSDGTAYKGWFDNKGERTYFDKETGIMAKPGLQKINGETYLFEIGSDGKTTRLKYGLYRDGDTYYYFNEEGKEDKKGAAVKDVTILQKGIHYEFDSEGKSKAVWQIK